MRLPLAYVPLLVGPVSLVLTLTGCGKSKGAIDLGELEPPRVTAGYSDLTLILSPAPSALPYKPVNYIIETQAVSRSPGDSRRSDRSGKWTVALKIPFDKNEASAGIITGLSTGVQLLVRYKVEMENGRFSNPSLCILASTKPPDVPSAPSLVANDTSDTTVSVLIIPPLHNNGANVSEYFMQYGLLDSRDDEPSRWMSVIIPQNEASKPFTVSALSAGQWLQFRVSARNSVGSSIFSTPYFMSTNEPIPTTVAPVDPDESHPVSTPKPGPSAPDKVVSFNHQSSTSNSVTLSWTAPSNN
ncbi:immunoglobulin super DCC subclass member, partial [Perkinsus chesapeaki]